MFPSPMSNIYRTTTVLLLASLAQSQLLNFSPGDLPTCAENCQTLKNAQTVCVPPAAPAAGQQAYQSCFCQSAYLTTLKQSPAGICDSSCPNAADTQQIQKWYLNLCQNGVGAASASTTSSAGPTSSAVPHDAPNGGIATTGSSLPAYTSTTDSATGTNISGPKPSWWSQHGRWIAMLIVLLIAFAVIVVAAVVLKRRYNRKRNRATAEPLPPTGWGPNLNPHSYPGVVEKGEAESRVVELARKLSHKSTKGIRPKKFGRR